MRITSQKLLLFEDYWEAGKRSSALFRRNLACLSTLFLVSSAFVPGFASSNGEGGGLVGESQSQGIPFQYAAGHVLLIPVKLCGKDSTFILDTGCGVNIISQSLAESLSCKVIGKHSGRRMSGQKLDMQIAAVPSFQIGNYIRRDLRMAKWNLNDLLEGEPDLASVDGLVSLDFFKDCPFTMDYGRKTLFIETDITLKRRLAAGRAVPVELIQKNGCETGVKVSLRFSNGKKALAEVDTGSSSLTLDSHYMKVFGIKETDAGVKVKNGTDETGHSFKRVLCELQADVFLDGCDEFKQSRPKVQFQEIIHQALIGDSFLQNFVVTYDLPHKRMIFAHPTQ
jgi:hypothetical protein